ncbi:MAG: hypothetical protein CL569_09560 [Alphaproteobacteria bacterium]|nr:hypothetical protein [Alphaproteobacteria bacterium]|tara:strand:- start:3858 stop:4805 length:948 start_codon:yes stop_codon:yes gene_type:complete
MTILVTGGTGFIGGRVARNLLSKDESVVCMDYAPNPAPFADLGDDPRLKIVQGDTTHVDDVVAAIRDHDVHRIIHLAALLPPTTEEEPRLAMRINIMGATNVFEAAARLGLERVVYASSVAAYDDQEYYGDRAVNEDDDLHPYIIYGYTKMMNEVIGRRYTERFGLDTRALRPASVIGYGRMSGRSAEVSRLICGAAIDGSFKATQSPKQTSSLIHVDDIVEMFVRLCIADALERDAYVSGGTTASLEEIAELVRTHLPDAEITFPDGVDLYPNLQKSDGSRLARDIKYQFPDIETRIVDTINEARRDHGMPPLS